MPLTGPKLAMGAVQTAVRTALGTNITIGGTALVVYGWPSPNTQPPYITIGEARETDEGSTHDGGASMVYQTVSVWDKGTEVLPTANIKAALSLIRQALDRNTTMTVTDGTFRGCEMEGDVTTAWNPDMELLEGRITFKIHVDGL